jgi:hypothetical protein
MLLFIDQDKHVRIVRVDHQSGTSARAPIGRLLKSQMQISDELRGALTPDEEVELEQVIDVYTRAAAARAASHALNFPAIMREVMDFYEGAASSAERQLIMGSLTEAARRKRKFERDGHEF